jgi:hypothetical protein
MRVRLLVFRCFTHDSQRVLTAVCEFALVHVEPLLNIVLCRFDRHQAGGKLHVTVLADAEQGMVSHDPKFSFCHAPSLRCPPRRSSPVEIKLHHYLFSGSGAVGVGTIESCEGGPGHAFPEPRVRLAGGKSEGCRAL